MRQLGGDLSCCRNRKILLPEVHSVRTDGNGHINPVIDDEQHAGLCCAFSEYFGQPEKVPLAEIFLPELNNPRPAFDEAGEDFEV